MSIDRSGKLDTTAVCVREVIRDAVLPTLNFHHVDQPVQDIELSIGEPISPFPPPEVLLRPWRALIEAPAARRPSWRRALRALLTAEVRLTPNGCLTTRPDQLVRRGRERWLLANGRPVAIPWDAEIRRLTASQAPLTSSKGFVLPDSTLLLSGVGAGADWLCLVPAQDARLQTLERDLKARVACLTGSGDELLTDPRLRFPEDRPLAQLALSPSQLCAIDRQAAVICCGERRGQPPAGTFTGLSVQDGYACAVATDGAVHCWGEGDRGQTRPPAGRYRKTVTAPWRACGLTTNSTLQCWGAVGPELAPPPGRYRDLALGHFTSHAIRSDGTLVSWGARGGWTGAGPFAQVSADSCQVCGLGEDGRARCGSSAESMKPAEQVSQIAVGCLSACGLRGSGEIACWGDLTRVGKPPPGAHTHVAADGYRYCALDVSGRPHCWGQAGAEGHWSGRLSSGTR